MAVVVVEIAQEVAIAVVVELSEYVACTRGSIVVASLPVLASTSGVHEAG